MIYLNKKQKDLLKVSIIGFFSSLMLMLMLYVALAQFFISYLEENLSSSLSTVFLILGLFFISLISSVFASYLLLPDVRLRSSFYSSILSYLFTFFTIVIISYISLFLYYPSVFDGLVGLEYVLVLPYTIVYFSVYVLPDFFYLFLIEIILYYLYFSMFFSSFYSTTENTRREKKEVNYQGNYI